MADLDLDKLLAPISPDSPCGEDLSYDPGYMELESYLVSLDASLVGRDDMVGMTSFGYEPQVAIAAADRLRAMFSA